MTTRPTIAYQPALDGVRALAVVAVLLFHGEVPGFDGGYLGVSVFFTLSGFLITSLLLREHRETGGIDLATFYGRRLRRLLPASALVLGAVVVFAAVTDWFDGVTALRDHVLGSVLQVVNWVFLAGDGSYQDLLARTSGTSSPIEHFWSLAIEEQFYWIWPPTMALLLARLGSRRGRIWGVGAITAVSLVAAPVIAQVWGPDAAYWSTPARIGEILVGAFVAVALVDRNVAARLHSLAPTALVILAIAVVMFPAASGPAYEGWLPAVALVSGALLVGLQAPGPIRDALSLRPLVALGRISYGVYLVHWPIYVILTPERTELDGVALLAVRLLLTLAISQLSYQLLERPIRQTRRVGALPTFGGAAAATVAVLVATLAVVPGSLGDYWLVDDETEEAAAIEVDDAPLTALVPNEPTTAVASTAPADGQVGATLDEMESASGSGGQASDDEGVAALSRVDEPQRDGDGGPASDEPDAEIAADAGPTAPEALPGLARPVRIVVTGDSTARAIGSGVVAWAAANPDVAQAEVHGAAGCGFVQGGARSFEGTIEIAEGCIDWVDDQLLPQIELLRPDVVMVMVTAWDVFDQRWDDGDLLSPVDPPYAERIDGAYSDLVVDLLDAGASRVAFVRHPIPDIWWLPVFDPQEDPARHQVIYDTYQRLTDDYEGVVSTIDLDRWFTGAGLDDDEATRPDGVHLTPEAAADVMDVFLGERLVRIALGDAAP